MASKVFYYLEEFDESLRLALEAGDRFDINDKGLYVETLLNQCIEKYIKLKQEQTDRKRGPEEPEVQIDQKMEVVIDKMFKRCFQDKKFTQAIGIALEARRLDKVKEAIELSGVDMEENLGYTFTIAQDILKNKDFRTDVLKLLLWIYQNKAESENFDHYKIAKCQFHLQLPQGTADLLEKLAKNQETDAYLDAYQIAFDICDKENQSYQAKVLEIVRAKIENYGEEDQRAVRERLNQIVVILQGEIRDRLYLQFLKKNNHTDVQIINGIKKSIGPKSSILHGATVWSNAIMNAYTTNDTFL